jgi:amino acid adenylation domain-containing protein
VELLGQPWSPGKDIPLFDVAVMLKNIHHDTLDEYSPKITVSFERHSQGINGEFCFNSRQYRPDTIQRLASHYQNLLEKALANPDREIGEIDLLSPGEKQQLLVTFNETTAEFPVNTAVHHLVDRQAEITPGANAVIYKEQRLSYRELKNQSDRAALYLRQKGLTADQIAAVLLDHRPGMVITLIAILKAGAAYLPIEPGNPAARIEYMIRESSARYVITTGKYLTKIQHMGEKVLLYKHLLENPSLASTSTGEKYEHNPNNLAYIIYTSGSTGAPKGVMIEHRSFIDFTTWAVEAFEHRPGYQVLLSNSYASDGSIQQIFPPLVSGGTLHLVDKELRLDIPRYLEYLEKNKINNIDEVPVLMNELLARLEPGGPGEKLPELTCLSLGSEYVPIELVRKCRKYLNHSGRIINAYGPAEASVETTTYHFDGTSSEEKSLIGKPRRNIRVYIMDEAGNCCPVNARGEIRISGVGLARGYLNQPQLTAEKFDHDLWDYWDYHDKKRANFQEQLPGQHQTKIDKKFLRGRPGGGSPHVFFKKHPAGLTGRRRLYKTGDLGRWLPDGNIEFFGRSDDQIKIRGHRVELTGIQQVLKNHESIKDAVVLAGKNSEGESELYAYYVTMSGHDRQHNDERIKDSRLRQYLEDRLPSYMMPAALVELEKIPLTPNGKVDKRALPQPAPGKTAGNTPPRNQLEKELLILWAGVLNRDPETIGIHNNFFQVGGHSLKATILTARIQKQFKREMPIVQVFKTPTISGLADYLRETGERLYTSIQPVELREYYSLTPVQKRLYILRQLAPAGTAYNVPGTIVLAKNHSKERLEEIFKTLIARHEILRTSFRILHDQPVQCVHDEVEFEIESYNLGNREKLMPNAYCLMPESIIKNFVRPFDLSWRPCCGWD